MKYGAVSVWSGLIRPPRTPPAAIEVLTEAQTEIDAGQVRFYRILARKLQSE